MLYGCEVRSFTQAEYLGTGSWGEYLGSKWMRMGSRECFSMSNFVLCTVHIIIVSMLKSRRFR